MASCAVEVKRFVREKLDRKLVIGIAAATSSAVVLTYLYNKMRKRLSAAPDRSGRETHPIDPSNQSKIGQSGERTSHLTKDGEFTTHMFEDARTVHEALKRGIKASNNGPCMGTRSGPNNEYQWVRYQEVYDRAQQIGSGLLHKGLEPGEETFVGIYATNRLEWVLCDQACCMFSLVSVPLYDTLGAEACSYIINQTQMTTVLVDTPEKAQLLLDSMEKTPCLKRIVVFDPLSNNNMETAQRHGVQVLSLTQLQDEGRQNMKDPVPPKPDSVMTLCYTSGTTGPPKGVILTHENIIANVSAMMAHGIVGSPDDVYISYLPLAHMMERTIQKGLLACGSQIGFYRGDVKLLMEDIGALKPTIFLSVPRLLNRMYDKVMQGVSASKLKQLLFTKAFNSKKAMLDRGIVKNSTIWDLLVFKKLQKLLGGRVRVIMTGSAPAGDAVLEFLRICFGVPVMEGYGQTECTAGVSTTLSYDVSTGHVGAPIPSNAIKLVDVPEMEYFARDNKGEVCVKGPSVMKGYYKDPERTAETVDEDGWVHTGDIGQWLANGALKIVDRKKHIFKLAQGEYLAPEKLENIYSRSRLVAQCFVEGNSLETHPVAVVVPDMEVIPGWAGPRGLPTDMAAFCKDETAKMQVLEDMHRVGKEAQLKGFEMVKNILLYPEPFSVENELLTPTFKLKRPTLRKAFERDVKVLYEEGSLS